MEYSTLRYKFGFAVLSLFIVWHVVAITVAGPFSQSYLRDNLMTLYEDYLALFHLDRAWPFYAPNPNLGSILSYETVSASGELKPYPLSQARTHFSHAYFRYTNFYAYLFNDPQYTQQRGYDKSVARYLCAQHADQEVHAIRFILQSQSLFSYQDYRAGKRPLDKEFLETRYFGPYLCAQLSAHPDAGGAS